MFVFEALLEKKAVQVPVNMSVHFYSGSNYGAKVDGCNINVPRCDMTAVVSRQLGTLSLKNRAGNFGRDLVP